MLTQHQRDKITVGWQAGFTPDEIAEFSGADIGAVCNELACLENELAEWAEANGLKEDF
jgi:hypothetical protein